MNERLEAPPSLDTPAAALALSVEQLRDPSENTAFYILLACSVPAWLFLLVWAVASFGLILIVIGVLALVRFIAQLLAAAYIRTNGVRVSASQFPELHQVVETCSERLGMSSPEVYVLQENVWNAFATRIAGRQLVVLLSGAIDSILLKGNLQQLAFLIGHELGHHAAGHLGTWRRLTVDAGGWLVWIRLWYSRRSELTCDRIGLYCAGSVRESLAAVCNMTVGAQLAEHVDIAQAIAQWEQHRREFFVRYRTIYSTHPHKLWRLEELCRAAQQFGIAA